MKPLLSVRDLAVEFATPEGAIRAVNGVSFDVFPGETLGIIGESGCGKSTTALALLGLIPEPAGRIRSGEARWGERDLLALAEPDLRRIRGAEIAMIFQDPLTALHPALKILDQVAEAIRAHRSELGREAIRARAVELLEAVGISERAIQRREYPHQWSGGMRQRALIAMALANRPRLLIADEPTTALDVTVQAQVLDLLRREVRAVEASLILITHDLAVIAELADRVAVMYAGRIIESGPAEALFASPRHPYTAGLLATRPGIDAADRFRLSGHPPDPRRLPAGCPFYPRCRLSRGRPDCRERRPALVPVPGATRSTAKTRDDDSSSEGLCHRTACHFSEELDGASSAETAEDRREEGRGTIPRPAEISVRGDRARSPRMAQRHEGLGPVEVARIEAAPAGESILRTERITTVYPASDGRRPRGAVTAVDGVSLSIEAGEILGLVGESGCGKSTLARTLVGLERATSGKIFLDGEELAADARRRPREARRKLQIVFQDPYASLNPRRRVGEIVAQPLRVHGMFHERGGRRHVRELLEMVELSAADASRFPHELSGGERQRVAIARALAPEPRAVVLDEPVTALDVAVRAQILDLLDRLRRDLGTAFLLIAHDLSLVRQVANRIAVMYLGRIVEAATTYDLFERPTHPYTRALLSSAPIADRRRPRLDRRIVLEGEVPDPADPPPGCRFHTRCWRARPRCRQAEPSLKPRRSGQESACYYPLGEEGPSGEGDAGPGLPPGASRRP